MEDAQAIGTLILLMLIIMIWQGIHILVTNHRLKRERRVLANHERALTALTVMGLLTDSDWERGERKRRGSAVVIEPVRRPPAGGSGGSDAHPGVPDHYERWPKPPTVGPVGGAGNSGEARR